MRILYFTFFFLVIITIIFGCCDKIVSQNTTNYSQLRKEFGINNKDFKKIKGNNAVIKELKLSLQDSLTKVKASAILKSFFLGEFSEDKLLPHLGFNRVFKGKNYRNIDLKDIDSSKAIFINDIEELEEFRKKFKAKPKVKVNTTTKVDSAKTKNKVPKK
ncbi:MAG: hypothetical protein ED556_09850 [Winogradskyella sp.]|uniref:hypothetical protein n=1 Tax=Winogradskyella sp. TaxID=1883156 RepID=UPI000F3FBC67|nr:hypothetical protein [Winogradskyella sp.]RNC84878.1 MAG: hypothetical protein ED556_09850 [Winogradskyella sp.]